jgi:NDP-sugar pyrophosphorylase family protein
MAGGEGKRMRPLTESCPKAMLKIGDKPILEHVLDRFIDEGYINFCFSVKYMSHIIKDYFGDGSKWGVSIKYLEENVPLGTAGSLSLLDELPEKPILVTNCDVLTEVKYSHLIEYHQAHNAAATMAVREYEWAHPFGVVELSEHRILSLKEKPIYKTYINAGIYALEPSAMKEIVKNSHLDMTDLFDILIDKGMNTVAYPTHEYWFDVGRPADFHVATNRVLGVE